MADDKKDKKDSEEGEDESSSKTKLMMIVGVLVLLVGGGGAYVLLGPKDEPDGTEAVLSDSDIGTQGGEAQDSGALYIRMKPPFIINYKVEGKQRLMQVYMTAMTRHEPTLEIFDLHMPLIRNNIVTQFSTLTFSEIQTHSGRLYLQELALEEINKVLTEQSPGKHIEKVFFTNLVMQ